MKSIICIDYDGSYTDFPELFDTIIAKSKELGYQVILATMRYEKEIDEGLSKVMAKVDRTIFTERRAKAPYLLEKGIAPDLWIDDNPYWLVMDSK